VSAASCRAMVEAPTHRRDSRERAGEALPAYCVADFSPAENSGKGADFRVSVVFQTQRGIDPGQISRRVSHPGKSRGSRRGYLLPK
jgi:hypothetical protein